MELTDKEKEYLLSVLNLYSKEELIKLHMESISELVNRRKRIEELEAQLKDQLK